MNMNQIELRAQRLPVVPANAATQTYTWTAESRHGVAGTIRATWNEGAQAYSFLVQPDSSLEFHPTYASTAWLSLDGAQAFLKLLVQDSIVSEGI